MPAFDLASFLPYQLSVAASRVSAALAAQYRRDFGLSLAEWRVLAHLAQSGTVSVHEIHARVDMDKPKVSRAASRLGAAGLIVRAPHPTDGRLIALSLTPQGKALMGRLLPLAQRYQQDLIGRLGPDADALHRALATLAAAP